ncbi:hypothetical protein [Flavobacterium silvaticum]|uniref:Phosphoribosylpyrophosphate synthetase n=1 Tax=Flavobacterium silvaticum TaxID=1852020 RepID=A0A972JHA1_9FLAO|nr:hypothetical protein [Flavobacterium silvaticum]NMH27720.1 hypothetical protein [Flavobacterium silvaticum]
MITTEKTLTQVLEILRHRGYTNDFNLIEENLSFSADGKEVNPADLVIDKIYRFSSYSDLDDEAILYAIHNSKDGAKGVFVNAYGTYNDDHASAIIDKIPVHENDADDWTR